VRSGDEPKIISFARRELRCLDGTKPVSGRGSADQFPGSSAFTVSQVSSVVAIGVVFENLGRLASVEPPVLESCDEEPLDLGQCQGWSFF
jgi:hypothetical protein